MCTDRAAAEGSIGAFHGRSWIQRRTNPLERCKRWAHSAEPRASPSTSAHPVIRVRASPHPVVLGPRVARKVRTPPVILGPRGALKVRTSPVILGPRGALKVRTSPVILGSARGAEGAHTPVILGPRGARKARSAGPRIHVVEATGPLVSTELDPRVSTELDQRIPRRPGGWEWEGARGWGPPVEPVETSAGMDPGFGASHLPRSARTQDDGKGRRAGTQDDGKGRRAGTRDDFKGRLAGTQDDGWGGVRASRSPQRLTTRPTSGGTVPSIRASRSVRISSAPDPRWIVSHSWLRSMKRS